MTIWVTDEDTTLTLGVRNCNKSVKELSKILITNLGAIVYNTESTEPCDETQMNVGLTQDDQWTVMRLVLPEANKEEKPENPVENQEID